MMISTGNSLLWKNLAILLGVVLLACLIGAAPPPEEYMGSRVYFRDSPNTEDNMIPMTVEGQQQQPLQPMAYEPRLRQSENALFNYLLARRLMLGGNRQRSFVEPSSNDISSKRSYSSRYCSFNAVSCFGK